MRGGGTPRGDFSWMKTAYTESACWFVLGILDVIIWQSHISRVILSKWMYGVIWTTFFFFLIFAWMGRGLRGFTSRTSFLPALTWVRMSYSEWPYERITLYGCPLWKKYSPMPSHSGFPVRWYWQDTDLSFQWAQRECRESTWVSCITKKPKSYKDERIIIRCGRTYSARLARVDGRVESWPTDLENFQKPSRVG